MSVHVYVKLLQEETSGEITLYMKGADVVMQTIVQYNDWLDEEVRKHSPRHRFCRCGALWDNSLALTFLWFDVAVRQHGTRRTEDSCCGQKVVDARNLP